MFLFDPDFCALIFGAIPNENVELTKNIDKYFIRNQSEVKNNRRKEYFQAGI